MRLFPGCLAAQARSWPCLGPSPSGPQFPHGCQLRVLPGPAVCDLALLKVSEAAGSGVSCQVLKIIGREERLRIAGERASRPPHAQRKLLQIRTWQSRKPEPSPLMSAVFQNLPEPQGLSQRAGSRIRGLGSLNHSRHPEPIKRWQPFPLEVLKFIITESKHFPA